MVRQRKYRVVDWCPLLKGRELEPNGQGAGELASLSPRGVHSSQARLGEQVHVLLGGRTWSEVRQ